MRAYLDHAATTPLRPEVVAAMAEVWADAPGNPTGSHAGARLARRRLEDAREVIAALVGADPGGVVFTGGGTEADNLAVNGARGGGRVVCSAVEHPAVLRPTERAGGAVAPVTSTGAVDLDELEKLLDEEVGLVSVMAANNETGVIQPLAAVAEVVARRAPQARLHTDAVQAAAWLDLPGALAPAGLVSLSAHKLGGPAGVGALVVKDGGAVEPLLVGGGQERERRAGTPDVAGAVGFAKAVELTLADRATRVAEIRRRRDRLASEVCAALPGVVETIVVGGGSRDDVLPNICHLCFEGVESESLLFLLDQDGVAATAGSSCSSGAHTTSSVLGAMGIPPELARGALRLSLGWSTTDEEVDVAVSAIVAAVRRLRGEG